MSSDAPEFLDVDDVMELHLLQLARFGGGEYVHSGFFLAVSELRRPRRRALSK